MTGHTDAVMHGRMHDLDFDETPLIVIWEMTQACALACKHCRADARPWRDDRELTTQEAKELLDDVAYMGTPVVVFSGGDPMNRPDIYELVRYGTSLGLRMCTIPAATDALTREQLVQLGEAGIAKVAFSIDASNPEVHDGIRGIDGTFERSITAARWAREIGLSSQVNTLVSSSSIDDLPAMAKLVEDLGADMWELMFLIPTGRGINLPDLSAQECERAFEVIYAIEKDAPFVIKVTEAPHYRRFMVERGHDPERMHKVNAGRGFAFVSHIGEAMPSGFLPESAGNVRDTLLSTIYRESPLFRKMRDPEALHGPCGKCSYRMICGGSRSRAFAIHGDPQGSEAWCILAQEDAPSASL